MNNSGDTPSRPKLPTSNKDKVILGAGVLGIAFIGCLLFLSHPHEKKAAPNQTQASLRAQADAARAAAAAAAARRNITPSNNAAAPAALAGPGGYTAGALLGTRKDNASNTHPSAPANRSLAQIPQFKPPTTPPNGRWTAAPYSGAQTPPPSQEDDRDMNRDVSAPSLIFSAEPKNSAGGVPAIAPAKIDNFGYEPGYHIAARLESVASTALAAPVVAVVEYNYTRDGMTLIPAGSRVIGRVSSATATGIMMIEFKNIYMPDGQVYPLSAVATNTRLGPLKGVVTGRNRGKQFLLGLVSGLGSSAALFAGGNNINSAYSESDMLREQAASNMGNAINQQIGQLTVSQQLIVTVAAGTRIYVTFTTPALAGLDNTAATLKRVSSTTALQAAQEAAAAQALGTH